MYALVDCNNFYASCERLFNPSLRGKAIVVLSNNDGCVIARSEEAKALGIAMGTPAFSIRKMVEQNKVQLFSSNYTLYGDISDRVMQTLCSFAPGLEIYSIDEAFLQLENLVHENLLQLGNRIRHTVAQHIGVPVSVGIAPSKTLAKMANRYSKKQGGKLGLHWIANEELRLEMLQNTPVNDVWGVGHQYAMFLQKNGFRTAAELADAPTEWIKKNMTVVGERLVNELRGVPCISNRGDMQHKKNICVSRSFGSLQTNAGEIEIAVANYAASCAVKLRAQHCCCKQVNVFIQTNPHRVQDKQHMMSITVRLDLAANDNASIIKAAVQGFKRIFQPGFNYLKCGVTVMDFVPETSVQHSLFSQVDSRQGLLMKTMDDVNKCFGNEKVRTASQGFEKRYRLKSEYLSPRYSTDINQILKVYI